MRNTDPGGKWNDPAYRDDPIQPWNDRMYKDDPFAPWNDPAADVFHLKKEVCKK